MDRGLWITWYDLPEQGREAYLAWLHGTYLPELLKRPGYLAAAHYAAAGEEMRSINVNRAVRERTDDPSVPGGTQYALIVGARDANVFGDPVPTALHASLPEASRKMLAMRIGERVNIMAEGGRIEGPDAKNYQGGMTLSPCIQLGSYNCPWQHEVAMLGWYVQSTMRAMSALPGCVRMRKLSSVAGWAKHAVIYEFVSLQARNENFITNQKNRSDEAKAAAARITKELIHAPGSSMLACRIWPAVSK